MAILNTEQAAQRLSVTTRRVRAMIQSGLLKAAKLGRDWAIDSRHVEVLRRSDRKPGPKPKRGRKRA